MKKLVFLMGMILFLAACSNSRLEPKPSYGNRVSEFKATDEDGKMFSSRYEGQSLACGFHLHEL